MLQNPDRRIVFAIPYEQHFTLIGTTDEPWNAPPGKAEISQSEIDYLCETVNRYFERNVSPPTSCGAMPVSARFTTIMPPMPLQ
jgi:glycerol-3-phosphate dehydrogenase